MKTTRDLAGLMICLVLCGCTGAGEAPANGNARPGGATTQPASRSAPSARSSSRFRRFPLDTLPQATITLRGRSLRVWLAITEAQHMEGLMYVPADEIGDDQGMLFVFPDEEERSFWMKNTITALDIAYMRDDGTIVKTYTMPPLTLNSFPSVEPARWVLEMKSGTFARLGIVPGDVATIPAELRTP